MPRLWRLAAKYPEVYSLLNEVKALRMLKKKKEGKRQMTTMRWEYCIVPIRCEHNKVHILLNEYGEDGWQLIQVVQEQQTKVAYMKRPLFNKTGPKPKDQGVAHSGTQGGISNG